MKTKIFITLFLLLGLIASNSSAQSWGSGWGIPGRSSWVTATADTVFLDRANQDVYFTRSAANTLQITATTWLPAANAPTIGSPSISLGETWWDVSGSGAMQWHNTNDRFEHDNSGGKIGMLGGGATSARFYLYGDSHANAGQFILDAARAHFRPDSSSSLTYIFVIEDTTGQAANDLDTALAVTADGNVIISASGRIADDGFDPIGSLTIVSSIPRLLFRDTDQGDVTDGWGLGTFDEDFVIVEEDNTANTSIDVITIQRGGKVDISASLVSDTYNFAADAQADDDYEVAIPEITALTTGLMVTFTANTLNTDGATLEITSVGDLDAILKMRDQALVTGDIEAGQVIVVVFDGTNWQMTSQLAQ